jgi:DNA replication protein DnaC
MTAPAAPRPIDVHALPAMLTALRLPTFQRHWQAMAERADAEGWPASRFLASLAELEMAERDARRIHRHLQQSQLPGGKTLGTLDFKALPGVTRARVDALAAGDWIETGANLIAIGNSGAGKTHLLCAIGHTVSGVSSPQQAWLDSEGRFSGARLAASSREEVHRYGCLARG